MLTRCENCEMISPYEVAACCKCGTRLNLGTFPADRLRIAYIRRKQKKIGIMSPLLITMGSTCPIISMAVFYGFKFPNLFTFEALFLLGCSIGMALTMLVPGIKLRKFCDPQYLTGGLQLFFRQVHVIESVSVMFFVCCYLIAALMRLILSSHGGEYPAYKQINVIIVIVATLLYFIVFGLYYLIYILPKVKRYRKEYLEIVHEFLRQTYEDPNF